MPLEGLEDHTKESGVIQARGERDLEGLGYVST